MLRLFGAVATAALAIATDPEVSVACSGDTNITISIAYDRADVQLLKFASGTCNETSGVEYMQNATSNEVTIHMNMRDCGLRSKSRVTRGLRTILFDNVADLALGRHDTDADKNMIFYSNSVNLTCAVKDTYEVSLAYGKIDADYSAADAVAGGEKEFTFEIESTDADFNATQAPSTRAGDTVYLKISSPDVDFFRYKFAVTTCKFTETNETKDVVSEYKLFDNTLNSCQNNFLDFTMKYCNKTSTFGISHTVFTFDPTQDNNYTLTCSIKLCDFDVTDSVAKCNDVETNCNIPTIEPLVPDVDGGWTDWTEWDPKMMPMDTGCGESYKKKRSRTCTKPEKRGKGADCDGDEEEEETVFRDCEDCKVFGHNLDNVAYVDGAADKFDLCYKGSFASKAACEESVGNHSAIGGNSTAFKAFEGKNLKAGLNEMPFWTICPNTCLMHLDKKDKLCNHKRFCNTKAQVTGTVKKTNGEFISCEQFLAENAANDPGYPLEICTANMEVMKQTWSVEHLQTKLANTGPGEGEGQVANTDEFRTGCENACAGYGADFDCHHVPDGIEWNQ